MDYDTFKLIHSELIMSVQYIEQDLKLIYSILKSGEFYDNYSCVVNFPLGKLLKSLHEMDRELGYSKIKEKDYDLLNQIREIRNYYCHQCYIDFHYIEDPQEHDKAFQNVADRLHEDEFGNPYDGRSDKAQGVFPLLSVCQRYIGNTCVCEERGPALVPDKTSCIPSAESQTHRLRK